MPWIRRCPKCKETLKKEKPEQKWECQNCGWKE